MKKCSRCKKEKDESEFGKQKITKDGLNSVCKKCRNDYRKTTYMYHSKPVRFYYLNYKKAKKCTKCGKIKLIGEFCKISRNSDGYEYRCKECLNPLRRKHYYEKEKKYSSIEYYEGNEKVKICQKCKTVKPVKDFKVFKNGKKTAYCKKCSEKILNQIKRRKI